MKANKEPDGCAVLFILAGIVVAAFVISETTPYIGIGRQPAGNTLRGKDVEPELCADTSYDSDTKVLYDKIRTIDAGMSDEEIINQLSVDYQDLYDYYGGAEELY
ncbi:MAG: hypothetical protein II989_09485 [Bacteroidales bacterium]|nr:hypothetical protein [Bacteroidales bacterium]MBQ3614309.1 hypothetical protein [Bacteroidales bacterium]